MSLAVPSRDTDPDLFSHWYAQVARYPLTVAPTRRFAFDPATPSAAGPLLAAGARRVFHELLADRESATTAYVALHVAAAALGPDRPDAEAPVDLPAAARDVTAADVTADIAADIDADIATARDALAPALADLGARDERVRTAVLRERAPLALLGDCWLDSVSQPATQPAAIVNGLFAQHFAHRGRGLPQADQTLRRRRALADRGVTPPHVAAPDFLERLGAHDLTAWHGAFAVALARMPVTFLPELVGFHCAHHLLGVDDRLLATASAVSDADVEALLAHASTVGGGWAERVAAGARLAVAMERQHVALLVALADQTAALSLDAQVVRIVARHAPFAGRQHGAVRVGGELLTEALDPRRFDAVAFTRALRSSRQLKPMRGGDPRFLRAIRFGGPMFGIFDEAEAEVFARWAVEVQSGAAPDPDPLPPALFTAEAARWRRAVSTRRPEVFLEEAPNDLDDRELLHRMVSVERYPHVIAAARAHATVVMARAEVLFEHGARGRYTDATWFDYTPEALVERVEDVYWRKLVEPHRPLTAIPSVAEVVFEQKTFALGSLIDGNWAHRAGSVGTVEEQSDRMLFSIYADEMGRGDLRKNHITLMYQALASMGVELPHIADPAFRDQAELPDSLYGFSLHQLALAMFPDTFRDELFGYNLGIEMFGLGEMRMHSMQKLRHHGFDPCYEEAHLSIDNVSAGHARQSAEIVVARLDAVGRLAGPAAVDDAWRRIWRGYASFAYFVEHSLVRSVTGPSAATAPEQAEQAEQAELTI